MSLSLNRENKSGMIEWSESIASGHFFARCWDPAISELGIKHFQENGWFDYSQMQDVFTELDQIKEWVQKHLATKDVETVIEKVNRLQAVIPKAFVGHESSKLYIY